MTEAARACKWAKDWVRIGMQVTWTNHEPASSLKQWYNANVNNADPPKPPTPSAATLMVCYELPMYAAVCSGAITPLQLLGLYRKHWADNESWDSVLKGSWFWGTYNITTHSPTPSEGDIVFFNRMAHVAMSTGNAGSPGEIISVWGMDPAGLAAGTAIEITTVEAIYASVRQQTARMRLPQGIGQQAPGGNAIPEQKIEYSAPPW